MAKETPAAPNTKAVFRLFRFELCVVRATTRLHRPPHPLLTFARNFGFDVDQSTSGGLAQRVRPEVGAPHRASAGTPGRPDDKLRRNRSAGCHERFFDVIFANAEAARSADGKMRHIMVATDGSDGANRAIDIAAELAKAEGRTLSIVAVARPLSAEERQLYERIEAIDPAEVLAQRHLYEAEQRLREAGIAAAKTFLARGEPAEAIIKTIEDEKVDAIVVGRRGRGQLAGLVLGSVSQKLCSLAPCVVIVAP